MEGKLVEGAKVFDSRTVTFPLGEGSESNVCEGIERALEKFLKGEKSRLTLQPRYAFKAEGRDQIMIRIRFDSYSLYLYCLHVVYIDVNKT